MASMTRIRCTWAGLPGGSGLSQFYWATGIDGLAHQVAVKTFWDSIKDSLPSTATITTPTLLDVLEESNGQLQSSSSVGTQGTATGVGGAASSAPSGAWINWFTSDVIDGKRVRGRTFIVPLQSNQYDNDGSLVGACITRLQNAANALLATSGNQFCVWHRPTAPGATDGKACLITAAQVKDKVGILRSRRD